MKKELLKLAKEEGIQLTDEQLEAINDGACNVTNSKYKDQSIIHSNF